MKAQLSPKPSKLIPPSCSELLRTSRSRSPQQELWTRFADLSAHRYTPPLPGQTLLARERMEADAFPPNPVRKPQARGMGGEEGARRSTQGGAEACVTGEPRL